MKKEAKEWVEQLKLQEDNMNSELEDLREELKMLNLKINTMEEIMEEEEQDWKEKGVAADIYPRCMREKEDLERRRKEINNEMQNIESEIGLQKAFRKKVVKTLEKNWKIKEKE